MKVLVAALLLAVAVQAMDYTHLRTAHKVMPANPKHTWAEWQNIMNNSGAKATSGSKLAQPESAKNRIIGGSAASRGQFPWQAAISMDGQSFCGGSLISQTWVLTAGHCVYGVQTFVIVLGATSIEYQQEGTVVVQTRYQVLHSQYNPTTLVNDIAVINLPSAVPLSNYISLARLAPSSLIGNSLEGATVRISGWGKTSDNSNISPDLNFVDLRVISNSQCAQYYGGSVTAGTLCTIGNGASTCQGDSGGPLVALMNDYNYYEVGIVSFGSANGCLQAPAAFTRITAYLSWISANTGIAV